ncbi:MAG: SDR family oxidoreductase [Myxococcota bacterium]
MGRPRAHEGKVVLVTGASSGIGCAAALAFARDGADLVLAARRQDRLLKVAQEVERLGRRSLPVPCDVTREEDVQHLVERAGEAFAAVDVLLNNAGVGSYGPLEKIGDELLRRVFEVNVFGLMRVTRAALPLLRRRPGARVVNISSVLGHRGLPLLGAYGASKAAVNSLTESLRTELSSEGIGVLLVSPGVTQTEFRDKRLNAEGYKLEKVPFKGMSAEAVADAIVHASRTGKRDTVLTLEGRAMVYGNRLSPKLFDRVARRWVGRPTEEP